jgi:hypothetical protein
VKVVPQKASFVGALRAVLEARGDERSAAEIFGLTGFAFRLVVGPRIDLGGWAAFPWAQELPAAVQRLGYETRHVFALERHPLRAPLVARAVELIAEGPAVAFGIHLPAFGVAAPLDGDPTRLRISGILDEQGGASVLPAEALGGGDVPILFVLALGRRHALDPEEALRDALEEALRLGRAPFVEAAGAAGLAAYDRWIAALDCGHVDPAGHAESAQLVAEARREGAAFLASASLPGASLAAAADHFARSSAALAELADRFPFPPLAPLDHVGLERAAGLLRRARDAEARGLDALEQALSARERHKSASLRIEDATPADLYHCLADLPLGDLAPAGETCRDRVAPRLGHTFFAKVARDERTGAVVGHVYWAPLEESGYPVAAEGRIWFLFCPWVAAPLRGRGIGARLFQALREAAASAQVDGILTEATTLSIFLHESSVLREGFRELARNGEMRLCYLPLRDSHPVARYVDPPPASEDTLVVRHTYNCPLLYATRRAAALAARAQGVAVDEADAHGPEAGIARQGWLPNVPVAPDVLLYGLRARGTTAKP